MEQGQSEAIVAVAAMCGQAPELVAPVIEPLANEPALRASPVVLTLDADLRGLEVALRAPGEAVSSGLEVLSRALPAWDSGDSAWRTALEVAERISPADALWIGARFAGGHASPIMRYEAEWLMPAIDELLENIGDAEGGVRALAARLRGVDGHWHLAARGGQSAELEVSRVVSFVAPEGTAAVAGALADTVAEVVGRLGGERNPGELYARYLRANLHHYRPGAGRRVAAIALAFERAGTAPSGVRLELPRFPSKPALQAMANLGHSLEGLDRLGTIFGVLGLEHDAQDNFWFRAFRLAFTRERPPRCSFVIELPAA